MCAQPTISFEFFPPKVDPADPVKTEAVKAHFWQAVDELAALKPIFMTVTYGAGGSTRDWTLETAAKMKQRTGINTAAHLTCVNTMKDGIAEIANQLWSTDVKHIIALRGDIPDIDAPLDYNDKSYYHYANELVTGLKGLHDFEISVAAYPEKHPTAPDLASDIARLKQKCDAGAARAITQFFFDNQIYYDFVDQARAAGVTTPIVPGLLPIHDFKRMCRVAAMCHATVPQWLHDKFAKANSPEEERRIGHDILTAQIEDLQKNGITHFHFYTLNRSDMITAACKATGLTP